ncbi:MAG: ADP-ribosylglycohydrolase family protein [Kiritimatiellia bacterium]
MNTVPRASWCALSVLALALNTFGGELRLSLADYRDKMRGAWVGQMVGVEWGAPTEFKFNDQIIPAEKVPLWKPEMINGAYGNDDLYVEMTFLRTLEEYGPDVSIRQAGIDFANSGYRLWCANLAGRSNLRQGIAPPDSSHPRFNRRSNDIDYQIEADYSGIIAPGLPQEVIRLGGVFGRLMNYGDGVWAGQFVGAMYAKAYFTEDVNAILDAGLAAIPAESDYAQMVRNVRAWHRAFPDDWTKAWEKIRATYRADRNPEMRDTNGGIDVRLNGAQIVMGLLYGAGDFDRSMEIAMRGGWDSDCNPSNVGGILMCARGLRRLDAKYASALDTRKTFSHTPYTFETLCAVCEQLARQIVVRHGGRVERDAAGAEWFVIPEQTPTPEPWVPSWKAPEPTGSRFTDEEMKRQKYGFRIAHPEKLHVADPTARVQNALDELAPGWKTSPNASDMEPGYRDVVETPKGGVAHCILTHPPARGKPAILSRRFKVPAGDPRLHFEVMNAPGGDFRLEVRIDGQTLFATDIGCQANAGVRPVMCPFNVSLAPWTGREVLVELVNRPNGWFCEAAIWHNLRLGNN